MPDGSATTLITPSVTIPDELLEAARRLEIDVSKVCNDSLSVAIARARREQAWIEENRAAMDSWNDYVAKHGIPFADLNDD